MERFASVEITSEDKAFPIESALLPRDKGGWRAVEPGVQTIRLIFDEAQKFRRISVLFEETETKRTQEFTLRWFPDRGSSYREIVRQQWNFSSQNATRETEDYAVDLSNVTLLDLTIEPDQENSKARAPLLSCVWPNVLWREVTWTNRKDNPGGACCPYATTPAKHACRRRIVRHR